MRKFSLIIIIFFHLIAEGQIKSFRFAFISDTHIGSPNGAAEEDLRSTVRDINEMTGIDFVVITGDVTELGTDAELKLAKQILDSLNIPYYIIPGNHDTGWSESGGGSFITIFGNDKFLFDHNGIRFMGCASGPYVRMSDGHVPRNAVLWMDSALKKTTPLQPLIFLNHYPIDNSLDNWYEIVERLKNHNTLAILCGHGHANRAMNFEDIPGVMGRSNLRARASVGGYNLVEVKPDSMIFNERQPGLRTLTAWTTVELIDHHYDVNKKFPRPDYTINQQYAQVKSKWVFSSDANIISTPAVANNLVVFGNQGGKLQAVSLTDGKLKWSFNINGAVFSSPAVRNDKLVFGSADGYIYCLNSRQGKLVWKFKTGAAVLGSPVIDNNTIYIGGSDHNFRAIDMSTGRQIWKFNELDGPVVSTPLIYQNKIIFGAWDRNLYALDKINGMLLWSWNNGSSVRNYSPASCIPVAHDGVVYVVAPDRYITAIDAANGQTIWRNNDATVRESIGISNDGSFVFAKTMQDTIAAYTTSRSKQQASWKMNCGFGYEHVPSMLIEKEGQVFFGTRNGVVYSIDPVKQKILWAHKIDNSMVNTVSVIDRKHIIASTMDGKVSLLEVKE
jgi:outer membrane protein assembly factor BamB/predicted phosphodiesterase